MDVYARALAMSTDHMNTPVIVMNQFGDVVTGPGAARDNIMPFFLEQITKDEHRSILRSRRYSMEQSLKGALKKQAEKKQQLQATMIQRQRAVAIMCKIYVGSIYYEIGENTIKQAFEQFGPVRSIDMSYDQGSTRHKGYCFIEFETPEAAHMSLEHMQSVTIGGRAVKVGRLSNIGQAQHFIQQFSSESAQYNRVYLSNIHSNLQDDDIRAVFESFGSVLSCALVRNPDTGQHQGYGFLEYTEPQAMKEAIVAMNGFDLGGQNIRVGPCVVPPSMHNMTSAVSNNPANALNAARNIADMLKKMSGGGKGDEKRRESREDNPDSKPGLVNVLNNLPKNLPETLKSIEGDVKLVGTGQRNMLMQKLNARQTTETTVLCLKNMLNVEDLDDEVEGEVTEECSNYGQVLRVIIYQEKQSDHPMAPTIVKIFVRFSTAKMVENAITALSGRFFNGRKISATKYNQEMFDNQDYTH